MRVTSVKLPVFKPRNGLVRALIRKVVGTQVPDGMIAPATSANPTTTIPISRSVCVSAASGNSYSSIAQLLVERSTVNADVRGSSPRWGSILLLYFSRIAQWQSPRPISEW